MVCCCQRTLSHHQLRASWHIRKKGGSLDIVCTKKPGYVYQPPVGPETLLGDWNLKSTHFLSLHFSAWEANGCPGQCWGLAWFTVEWNEDIGARRHSSGSHRHQWPQLWNDWVPDKLPCTGKQRKTSAIRFFLNSLKWPRIRYWSANKRLGHVWFR